MKCVVLCEFIIVFQRKLVQLCSLRFPVRGLYHRILCGRFFFLELGGFIFVGRERVGVPLLCLSD